MSPAKVLTWILDGLQALGLRAKIMVAVLAGLLFMTLAFSASFFVLLERQITGEINAKGEVNSQSLARLSAYYVNFDLKDNLKQLVEGLSGDKDVAYVEFVGGEGRILAQGEPARRPQVFSGYDAKRAEEGFLARRERAAGGDGKPLLVFTHPIVDERVSVDATTGASSIESHDVGEVRLAFSLTRLAAARTQLFLWTAVIFVLVFVSGAGVVHFLSRLIVRPLHEMGEAVVLIAEGDLRKRVRVASRDEIADLAHSFNSMANNLEAVIGRMQEGNRRMAEVASQVAQAAERMSEGTVAQSSTFETISASIEEMNRSIQSVADSVNDLSVSAEETSSSILQMAATIQEVSSSAEVLTEAVNESAATTTEMVQSVKEIDGNVEHLNEFVLNTSSAVEQMDTSIHHIEQTSGESSALSGEVAEKARRGRETVEKTEQSMESIRAIVAKSSEMVLQLGRRSQEIDKIVGVIEDIAEQTNLLALNAAIIAAQAGEEGKGFAVVADEIRELAERTASSTKDIADLIGGVQEQTGQTIKFMKEGTKGVEEGVTLARSAGQSLDDILRSANRSVEMAGRIAHATKEQAMSSQSIRRSVGQVESMVGEIRRATREQAQGSEQILRALERMRELTNQVKRATVEQHQGSQLITEAVEVVTEKINHIRGATSQQAAGSQQILQSLERYNEIIESSRRSIDELQDVVGVLNDQTRSLEDEIRKFRLHGA